MDSPSYLSYMHYHEKNRDQGAGEIWSATAVVARDFFPLTPDLKGFLDTKELRQDAVPTRPKQKPTASLTDDKTQIVEKKAKRCRSQKEMKEASEYMELEERGNDVSTKLVMRYYDPYEIKKKLTKSDLGHLSRLLILRACVHVLPRMSEETVRQVKSSDGAHIVAWDADTHSGSYVLKGCWIKEFVQRSGLEENNEIGIY